MAAAVRVAPFLALRVVVAHAQLLSLRTARSGARCRGRAATPAAVSPSRGGSAGGWAAAESGRRRAAGGRQQGGVDGQRLGSWRSHAAGVRGSADQPESWAAKVRRGGADGRFYTMESREEDELLPGTWSVTRGDAGAGRNRRPQGELGRRPCEGKGQRDGVDVVRAQTWCSSPRKEW
jgi:hypothetical protein